MARKKIIAGNWKMNMTPSEAVELVNTLKPLVANDDVDVVFCVPAIDIIPVVEAAKGSNIQIGRRDQRDRKQKNAESFRARHHPDHVLRRNSGAERAGCNDGFHPSAGKGWIPECNSRSGKNSRYRLRANLGNRNRQNCYNRAG